MKIAGLIIVLLLVCGAIYFSSRYRDRQARKKVPVASQGYDGVSEETAQFLTEVRDEFNFKQQYFHKKWLSDYDRYDIDTAAGQLILTKGQMRTVLDVQSIGSACKTDSTWQWAWDNPNVPEHATRAVSDLKAVGARYGLGYLQEGKLPMKDDLAPWFLTGFALKVSKMDAVFVAKAGEMEYYFLVANPRVMDADDSSE